jgi:hypothetical protein
MRLVLGYQHRQAQHVSADSRAAFRIRLVESAPSTLRTTLSHGLDLHRYPVCKIIVVPKTSVLSSEQRKWNSVPSDFCFHLIKVV